MTCLPIDCSDHQAIPESSLMDSANSNESISGVFTAYKPWLIIAAIDAEGRHQLAASPLEVLGSFLAVLIEGVEKCHC